MPPKKASEPTPPPFSIRLYPEQRKKLKDSARKLRLTEQDTFRKALDFGLPALEQALTPQPPKAA